MWLLAFLIVVCLAIYSYLVNKFKYWEKLNVKFRKPNIIFGNVLGVITLKESIGQLHASIYRQFKDVPYVGYYTMSTPGLLIRDAELVKDILVKDFDSFAQNDVVIDEKLDPLLAKNAFMQIGDAWKNTRNMITPAFSSGKMKLMFPLMVDVTKNMNNYISDKISTSLEAKDLCGRFTIDNVATCAFGLEAFSFSDKDGKFREMGKKIFAVDFLNGLQLVTVFLFPSLRKVLRMRFFPLECSNYFISIVSQTMEYRAKQDIKRNDFLDMMAQLKVKHGKNFTDFDATAQAVGFFVDGYETSATTMSFVLYCIAKYTDVQTKLRRHIESVLDHHGGQLTYESVQEMNYLEMVILESMRQYPPIFNQFKKCTKKYQISPTVTIEPGTSIIIPTYALHNDDRYFPNPEMYDPERFSDENKQNIVKGSFLPFGDGPRMCLGQRFGLLQVKIAVIAILRAFRLSVNKKTIEPLQIDPKSFLTAPIGGLWLDYQQI